MQPERIVDAVAYVLRPLVARVVALEGKTGDERALLGELAALRERVAVLETRALVPGPPGADGKDGLGFGELVVEQPTERDVVVRAVAGERSKELATLRFPVMLHKGVWAVERGYERGDCVTYGGSLWHCETPTRGIRPDTNEGAPFWKLTVKRGDRGRAA
jgi:hypothetical protein